MKLIIRNFLFIILVCTLITVTGCTNMGEANESAQNNNNEQVDEQSQIRTAEFEKLIENNSKPMELYQYIDEHLEELSKNDLSKILIQLEDQMLLQLANYNDELKNTDIQSYINEIFDEDHQLMIEEVQDESIKEMLSEIQGNGYQIKGSKETFILKIDYTLMEKYIGKTNNEISDYIAIKALESKQGYEENFTLTISWDELSNRVALSELFINSYPESIRSDAIERIYLNYLIPYLKGLPNTTVYNPDSNQYNQQLLDNYLSYIDKYPETRTSQILNDYMIKLEESDYIYTQEVEQYLDTILMQYLSG
ncbi:hypothetical protein [Chengkuizengella axinellae]|uniref:Lipoprotein n=1 Tax=Chengkuizengella axinellae TaxID=3064388 RepID=A0ABT9IUW5_9BACL|nr:hypothetical protein [Chengkuizengella sp. 2205SS18-9]MDP5273073.1 hypothetical protein [Chengkuizengella sp. 2205SS18-9]